MQLTSSVVTNHYTLLVTETQLFHLYHKLRDTRYDTTDILRLSGTNIQVASPARAFVRSALDILILLKVMGYEFI